MNKKDSKTKVRLTIFVPDGKDIELKKNALDAGVSLSNYLSIAGTITSPREVKQVTDTRGAVSQ